MARRWRHRRGRRPSSEAFSRRISGVERRSRALALSVVSGVCNVRNKLPGRKKKQNEKREDVFRSRLVRLPERRVGPVPDKPSSISRGPPRSVETANVLNSCTRETSPSSFPLSAETRCVCRRRGVGESERKRGGNLCRERGQRRRRRRRRRIVVRSRGEAASYGNFPRSFLVSRCVSSLERPIRSQQNLFGSQ